MAIKDYINVINFITLCKIFFYGCGRFCDKSYFKKRTLSV